MVRVGVGCRGRGWGWGRVEVWGEGGTRWHAGARSVAGGAAVEARMRVRRGEVTGGSGRICAGEKMEARGLVLWARRGM